MVIVYLVYDFSQLSLSLGEMQSKQELSQPTSFKL